jgi:hypothetical protein
MKKTLVVLGYFLLLLLMVEYIIFPALTAASTLLNISGAITGIAVGASAIFLIEYIVKEEEPIKKSKNKKQKNDRV